MNVCRIVTIAGIIAAIGGIGSGFAQPAGPDAGDQPCRKNRQAMMSGKRPHLMSDPRSAGALVATRDGGVVVLCGNMLFKYDKQLNLVKQAELPCPPENPAAPCRMQHGGKTPCDGQRQDCCRQRADAEPPVAAPSTSEAAAAAE